MTSLLDEKPAGGPVRGCQTPRIWSQPPYASLEAGVEVVELCASVGVVLDEAQQLAVKSILAEQANGDWAALEGAVVEPRQNGKGEILLALEVGGLFLLDEELIIATAHEFKTAGEGFLRLTTLIENSDFLRRRVRTVRLTSGQEGVELLNGNRIKFMARRATTGRGFTAKRVILDEAQILSDGPIRAMLPTLSAVPNPQIVYAASAGNQLSVQLGAIRRRALAGGDPSLAYLEWSVDEDDYDPADPACWAQANPALGLRISVGYVAKERAAMSAEGFASERLGVGDWPLDDEERRVIPGERWLECADRRSARPDSPVVFAVDANPERSSAAVAVAGRRPDGMLVVELADQRAGLEWIVERCEELERVWRPLCWVVDKGGPAGTVVQALEDAGLTVSSPQAAEIAQSAEMFFDAVMQGQVRHCGDVRLDSAVAAASRRSVGQAWAWDRRTPSSDVSPLVAVSLALWGFRSQADRELAPDDVFVG